MRFLPSLALIVAFCGAAFGQSDPVTCGSDIRWLNTDGNVTVRRPAEIPVQLSFLVHLGQFSGCNTSAEIAITATYLGEAGDFICSGTIRSAMVTSSAVQQFNMAVRPFMQLDFLRWRNQPGNRGEQQGKRLVCLNIDGTADVGDGERQKARSMRLTVAVMPTARVTVAEAIFSLMP